MKDEFPDGSFLAVDDGRNVFESNHIAGHGGEVFVPEPGGCLFVAGDTTYFVGAQKLALLLAGLASEGIGEAGADDDYIAFFEFYTLLLCDGLDVSDGDLVVGEGVEGSSGLVGVALKVDEDTARDHATTLVPVIESGELAFEIFVAMGLSQLFYAGLEALGEDEAVRETDRE